MDSARSISMASRSFALRSFAHQEHATTPLDLQLPRDSPPAIIKNGGAAALTSTSFPSAIHHLDLGTADLDLDDRARFAVLGTGEVGFKVTSQAEMLARRVHREGFPIARLWESKSALLSIGLNQKGKPGMWLIQKVH
jgi:hypothetical protein